jgi:tRNA(adenine34) deaminase
MTLDEKYMQEAIIEAKKAYNIKEVPIGAVIVYKDEVIARGYNTREMTQKATQHAELIAIEKACEKLNTWRLEDCTLYVTIEPCPMCAGAAILSRVDRLVYGASDPKSGYAGTLASPMEDERLNHNVEVIGGVLEEECSKLMKDFFKELRKRK